MKKIIRCISAFLLIFLVSALLLGCADKCEDDGAKLDYSQFELAEYIKLGEYKDMEIALDSESASRSEAVWKTVVDNAEVIKYPELPLEYYIAQTQKQYGIYAEEGNMEYSELLESMGLTEADIEDKAKRLVKEDLVGLAIRKAEGIELSDEERTKHLDRYVENYVTHYGYSEDYVLKNLIDDVYDSMLYDKMLEFLMLKNTFTVKE